MCKHWGLHISTNINCLGAVLGSFWAVWRGLFWCLKAKLRSWQFPRYWRFMKWYHGGYQLICLISQPLLIASRRDWYQSKGLFKGFKLALRLWESSKNWWRYDWMKFVTTSTCLEYVALITKQIPPHLRSMTWFCIWVLQQCWISGVWIWMDSGQAFPDMVAWSWFAFGFCTIQVSTGDTDW